MRNNYSILIAILLVMLLLPLPAAAEENPEILLNHSFETVEDGLPYAWSGAQKEWGENSTVEVSTEQVYDGSYSIKIENGDDVKPWINQQRKDLVPGATYKVSFWMNATLGVNAEKGAGVLLEFYRGASTSSGSVGSKKFLQFESTNNRWTHITGEFTLPEEATMVKLYCRLYSDGVAYFDNVSLKLTEVEKFSFETSHVFHYTDDETGTAQVLIHPHYADTGLSETVQTNFYIYDGDAVVAEKTNTPFSGEAASFVYSVPTVLQKKGHTYRLRIEVTDKSGTVLKEYEQNLYKYDRPEYLDADGNFRDENGEVFTPVACYHLSLYDHEKAVEAGFNAFQISYGAAPAYKVNERGQVFDAMDEYGLKGFFSLYLGMKAAGHPDNIENTKKIVEMYKDDPRVLGWLVQDEPLGSGITDEKKEWLEISYKTIREIDSKHPIVLTDYSSYVFKETVKYCDVFIPNSYSTSYVGVLNNTKTAVQYAGKKPVYPNVGAYARTGYADSLPTGDQLQHFMYQALMGGARGISMYSFSDTISKPEDVPIYNTDLWEPLKEMGNTELPAAFDLFLQGEDGVKTETATYIQKKWTREDGDYFCLLSTSENDQSITIDVGEKKNAALLWGESTQYLALSCGTLSVSLRSGDVLMLRVQDAKNSLSVTKNGIGITAVEAGTLTVTAPEGSTWLTAGLYNTAGGADELVRIYTSETGSLSIDIAEGETAYTLKAFVWDAGMRPSAKFKTIPGQ